MRSSEDIFSDFLIDIILQMDYSKKNYKESFLRSELITKIKNFSSPERLWDEIYVDEDYPLTPLGKHRYCDIQFKELLTEIKKENDFIRIVQRRKKCIWIELKFLTIKKNLTSTANIKDMMKDFIRLLFYTPLREECEVERFFIILMQCGDAGPSYRFYDPRKYFGIKSDPYSKEKKQISKLVYPQGTGDIKFAVKDCLSHLSDDDLKEAKESTKSRTLLDFNITRRFIGPAKFDKQSDLKEFEGQLYGYLFKLSS